MTESPLRSRLRAAATTARRERDRSLAGALGSALAALDNAEAVPHVAGPAVSHGEHVAGGTVGLGGDVARRVLSDVDEAELVEREVQELLSGAATYDEAGAVERAADLRRVAGQLRAVLTDRG
ncbi:hypothetical protein [Nocardioides ferulae]|uniref:hypothetical protein n=1 Tax=Nocardioides ferulae TaxID=2340821 RepID=UPI000EAEF42E|nr:hypothetical protein [Nocardioides ferulae]